MASRYLRRRRRGSCTCCLLVIVIVILAGLLYSRSIRTPTPRAIEHINSGIAGVDIISVNPSLTEIRPALPDSEEGLTGESFNNMIGRLRPDAAINGTFYDESMKPLGDILIDGNLVNKGHYPNALAVTTDGKVKIIRGTKRKIDWSGCSAGIAAGPRLVRNGEVSLNPNADGFSQKSLTVTARRSGVGVTEDGKLLLVTADKPITLEEFADIMLKFGAVDALNLDGGGACALTMGEKFYARPYLPMTNVLLVYKKDHGNR